MASLKGSMTGENLMRAFAGECQAWRRYEYAASVAKAQKLQVLYNLFHYTGQQEKEHAEVFYNQLKEFCGQEIAFPASYPVDNTSDMAELLRLSQLHEQDEHTTLYAGFADTAQREGFQPVAARFRLIAGIEATHAARFSAYGQLLREGKLFDQAEPTEYLCLNCGYVHTGSSAPAICPACEHDQGYFIRRASAPFEG